MYCGYSLKSLSAQLTQVILTELLHLCFLSQPIALWQVIHFAALKSFKWDNVFTKT